MTYKGILGLVFVAVLGTAIIISAADAPTLVFKDGSTIEVVPLTIVRGSVAVRVSASASEVRSESPGSEVPDEPQNSGDRSSAPEPPEDEGSADSAG
ncbi:MAG: hypothetical protein K8R59_07690 [Thermoanaerobaculales bacterium]|nr:hypothetical protein [Thermoanaerobaculales bacterium]